ncbi:MAG: alcohol dehydrogenase-like regulatory protein ErcA [Thermodesulfobacteriota bacterium]
MTNEDLLELRKFLVPEFVYGEGAIDLVGRYARNFGAKKLLMVTDPGIVRAGWAGRVEALLNHEEIPYVVYDGVTPNPKDEEVMAGAEVYRDQGCDVIVAVGGGSPIDCAKGIGIVSGNNKHILEFEGVDEVPMPGPPLICIPTTAGTSADISQFAIIVDTTRRVKIAIISKTVVPDTSLIDPETTVTMPLDLTAATGIDALAHGFEAYVSNASSPITDLLALEAIRLVDEHLISAVQKPQEMKYRNGMMMASLLAGMAFSNASLGLVHAMAHALGGLLDSAHGVCNAVLLEHVVDFNFSVASEKYGKIGAALGLDMEGMDQEDRKSAIIDKIVGLRQSAGIHLRLRELGVTQKQIHRLAQNALRDPCLATNPREPKLKEVEAIYEKAL